MFYHIEHNETVVRLQILRRLKVQIKITHPEEWWIYHNNWTNTNLCGLYSGLSYDVVVWTPCHKIHIWKVDRPYAPVSGLLTMIHQGNSCRRICTTLRCPAQLGRCPDLGAILQWASCKSVHWIVLSWANPTAGPIWRPDTLECRGYAWSVCASLVCSGVGMLLHNVCKDMPFPPPQFSPYRTLRTPATTKKNINFFFSCSIVRGPVRVQSTTTV